MILDITCENNYKQVCQLELHGMIYQMLYILCFYTKILDSTSIAIRKQSTVATIDDNNHKDKRQDRIHARHIQFKYTTTTSIKQVRTIQDEYV